MKTLLISLLFSATLAQAVDLSSIVGSDLNNSETAAVEQNTVFGSHLFSGNFTKATQHIYNPDYRLAIGDVVTVKMWGAFEFEQALTIDSQGNIFVPRVGTVNLLGVKNGDLVGLITSNIKKIYRNNVYVYADMAAYQNVSVFVTGNVNKPGLYQGLSSDSLLQYLDKASGINARYGSFRKIIVLRDNQPYKQIDLYDFLLDGQMEMFAFRTGDVILVESVGSYVSASGEVQRPFRFEAKEASVSLSELANLSGIKPTATNALVKSYGTDNRMHINMYPLNKMSKVTLNSGDSVEFMPDHSANVVQVSIEGEHDSLHTMIVPRGTTLSKVKSMIQFNAQSNADALQVYRHSVAVMQKKLIDAQLRELETLALTTPSVSPQEATMRSQESKSILDFIERARKVEPRGQIVINDETSLDSIVLEEGDKISVPTKNNIVVVQGEVALPGAFTYVAGKNIDDYINLAGDISERANTDRILVIRANGKAEKYDKSLFAFGKPDMHEGDAILVLPKAEGRNLMTTSVITQILYQIAIATKVVLNI
jgi:protein involved in polysaccharide export with SLBB domain